MIYSWAKRMWLCGWEGQSEFHPQLINLPNFWCLKFCDKLMPLSALYLRMVLSSNAAICILLSLPSEIERLSGEISNYLNVTNFWVNMSVPWQILGGLWWDYGSSEAYSCAAVTWKIVRGREGSPGDINCKNDGSLCPFLWRWGKRQEQF